MQSWIQPYVENKDNIRGSLEDYRAGATVDLGPLPFLLAFVNRSTGHLSSRDRRWSAGGQKASIYPYFDSLLCAFAKALRCRKDLGWSDIRRCSSAAGLRRRYGDWVSVSIERRCRIDDGAGTFCLLKLRKNALITYMDGKRVLLSELLACYIFSMGE